MKYKVAILFGKLAEVPHIYMGGGVLGEQYTELDCSYVVVEEGCLQVRFGSDKRLHCVPLTSIRNFSVLEIDDK